MGPEPVPARAPLIVGIGGGGSPSSSSEVALGMALAEAQARGAQTRLFGGQFLLELPHYPAPGSAASPQAVEMISAIRACDGLVLSSPGYHGTISGLIKNAIDFIEETGRDERPYLTDLPVGLMAIAGGHQAAMSTLITLRTVVHALRGWPTPFGAAIGTPSLFKDGICTDETVCDQIRLVGAQVARFAHRAGLPEPLAS